MSSSELWSSETDGCTAVDKCEVQRSSVKCHNMLIIS
uniref:Uncharacterized protein n=1 Tax=Triticum urartu TaxID=4572 RepID=A0A8R7QYS3_TRIUA